MFPKGIIELHRIENPEIDLLAHFKPEYPWKPEFIDKFKHQLETIDILKKKLEYYEKKK